MGIGTSNIKSTYVDGNTFSAAAANDIATLLSCSDDGLLFDLVPLDPPALASPTNVNVGYVPIRSTPTVTITGSARSVEVSPTRFIRSSTSVNTPRRLLSAVLDVGFTLPLSGSPTVGYVRSDLLCARITYRNALDPAQGTQVAFEWVNGGEVLIGNTPANPATPAHTSTSWVVPLAYVKNTAGANTVTGDITAFAPLTNAYAARVGATGGLATLDTDGKVFQLSSHGIVAAGIMRLASSSANLTGSAVVYLSKTLSGLKAGDIVRAVGNATPIVSSGVARAFLRIADGSGNVFRPSVTAAGCVPGSITPIALSCARTVAVDGSVTITIEALNGGSGTQYLDPDTEFFYDVYRP